MRHLCAFWALFLFFGASEVSALNSKPWRISRVDNSQEAKARKTIVKIGARCSFWPCIPGKAKILKRFSRDDCMNLNSV